MSSMKKDFNKFCCSENSYPMQQKFTTKKQKGKQYGENRNLQNHIQLIDDLLKLTDGNPNLQSSMLGKLGVLYEHSRKKNFTINNILSAQEEIEKLKMQSAKQNNDCYTDISSDWDSLPPSPDRQFKSKLLSEAPVERCECERKKTKRHRRRSSSKHNHNSKRRSRSRSRDRGKRQQHQHSKCETSESSPGRKLKSKRLHRHSRRSRSRSNKHNHTSERLRSRDRGKGHRTSHRRSDENRYEDVERYSDDSDAEKCCSFEDLASYSNPKVRHRAKGIDYKIKNKHGRPVKSSSSHRNNKKTNVRSNSDSSGSMNIVRKRIKYTKCSEGNAIKSEPANMPDQLASLIKSILSQQNIPLLKVEMSPIKTTHKNPRILSEHSTKKEAIETAKTNAEWVDSFDIELAEEINVKIDDEIIQKIAGQSSDSKNEAPPNNVVPNLIFDTEVVKQALATVKKYEKLCNPEPANVVEHHVQSPFTQFYSSQLSSDPRLQRLRVQDQRRDKPISLEVPTFFSPPTSTQPSNCYQPSISESFQSNERSFYPTERALGQGHAFVSYGSLQYTIKSPTIESPDYSGYPTEDRQSTSVAGHVSLSYRSLQHTAHSVTSPTYSGYEQPLKMRDKLIRSPERRKYERSNKEYLDINSFKNTETRMTYASKQGASIASAARNVTGETGRSNDNNSKFNSHLNQRLNHSTYGEYRRSVQPAVSSTSKSTNVITATVTRSSNTDPRLGNVFRSANNAVSNSKVSKNFEIQKAAREDDGLAKIHATKSVVDKQRAKGSNDSKFQKSVNIKQNVNRCDQNNSLFTNVNRSSNDSTYNTSRRNSDAIFSPTPLNSNRNRGNVCDNNSKSIPKINFKIPKKIISKTLDPNEIRDWHFEPVTTQTGSESQNNVNITETVENTESNISMQTIESASELNENTRTTSSEKENNVVTSSSSSDDLKEKRDTIAGHIRIIIDLIGKMTKENSLTKVQEVIEKRPKDTAAEDTETSYTSVDIKNTSLSTPKKRKNELDRLNEDIDTMFIRDGVLNATGRQIFSPAKEITKQNKSVDDFDIAKNDKPNSLLRARSNTMVSAPKTQYEQHHQPPLQKLKSIATTKRNFANKSTIKSNHKEKRKHPRHKVANGQDEYKKAKIVLKAHIKNDNREWHSLKKAMDCHLCDKRPGLSLVNHYVNFHPNHEVAVSRLAPDVADRLLKSTEVKKLKRVKLSGKAYYELKQFCYFCNAYKCLSRQFWINHMAKHTGYYQYECTVCSRKFGERYPHHMCDGQKSLRKIPQPHFEKEKLYAYICITCNFVRFSEAEIKMHIRCQHEIPDKNGFFQKVMFLSLQKKKKKIEFEEENDCDADYTPESEIETESELEETSQAESDGDYEWELDEMYAKELEQKYKEVQRKELEEEEYLEEQLARETVDPSSDEEYNAKDEKLRVSEANNEEAEGSNKEMKQDQILSEENKEIEMESHIEPNKNKQNIENESTKKNNEVRVSDANNEQAEGSNEEMEKEQILTEGNMKPDMESHIEPHKNQENIENVLLV